MSENHYKKKVGNRGRIFERYTNIIVVKRHGFEGNNNNRYRCSSGINTHIGH